MDIIDKQTFTVQTCNQIVIARECYELFDLNTRRQVLHLLCLSRFSLCRRPVVTSINTQSPSKIPPGLTASRRAPIGLSPTRRYQEHALTGRKYCRLPRCRLLLRPTSISAPSTRPFFVTTNGPPRIECSPSSARSKWSTPSKVTSQFEPGRDWIDMRQLSSCESSSATRSARLTSLSSTTARNTGWDRKRDQLHYPWADRTAPVPNPPG